MKTNKTIFETQSGVELIITPLTFLAQAVLQKQAQEAFPEPDKAPFEKPLENAFEEGDILPATENPDWQALAQAQAQKRTEYFQELILNASVSCENKDALINAYLDNYHAVNNGMFQIPFTGILQLFIITQNELSAIIKVIFGKLPLTEVEIRNGLTFFRYVAV